MRIRPATDTDRAAVYHVNEAAFGRPNEAALVDTIRASNRFVPELSLVADVDGELIGHIMLSYVDVEPGSHRVLQLAPLAVLPSHQRRGIGSSLAREALRRAETREEPMVLVEGNPAYYGRFGFRRSQELAIEPPPGVPAQFFMARPLKAYDPLLRGRAIYPEAFAAAIHNLSRHVS